MDKLVGGLLGNLNVWKDCCFQSVDRCVGNRPGNYALSVHSIEEIVSRDFMVDESSDAIINVVDVANVEWNLYLALQITVTAVFVIAFLIFQIGLLPGYWQVIFSQSFKLCWRFFNFPFLFLIYLNIYISRKHNIK